MKLTAFTPVSVRRALGRPTPPDEDRPAPSSTLSQGSSNTQKSVREWPQAVREYVQRSFATENIIEGIVREDMENMLKTVISQAAASNTLTSADWGTLLLPQQMIQRQRIEAGQMLLSPAWKDQITALPQQETNGVSNGTPSKKRKSDCTHAHVEHEVQPPWRSTNNRNVFEDRLSYPEKKQRNDQESRGNSKSQNHLENRKRRFEGAQFGTNNVKGYPSPKEESPMTEAEPGPVVGRCQTLEKNYLRLTSAPNPDTVRPLPVLQKTLDLLKAKWKKESNYSYICDQFKSLRQDLTVQHIKNEFTVNVYEIHARIALEKGDLGEYNQCQTQLRALYAQNLGGHPIEFKAYRILYFIHTCNRTDMNDVISDLTPIEKKAPAIKHALDARSALALGNYHKFFKLYLQTPFMGAYLMDMFVARERLAALASICKAYKPDVELRLITEELGFESDEEAARFLCENGGQAYLEQRENGDVKLLTGKVGPLFERQRNAAFQKVDIKGQI